MRPRKYNSTLVKDELTISMRQSKLGELFYMVSYIHDSEERYVCFESMSSVLDFIHSNF